MNNPVNHGKIFKFVITLIWKNGSQRLKLRFLFVILAIVSAVIASMSIPIIFKAVIDRISQRDFNKLFIVLIAYSGIWTMTQLLVQGRELIFYKLMRKALRDVSRQIFSHIQRLPFSYHISRYTGNLTSALERGSRAVDHITFGTFFVIFPGLIELGLITSVLWILYGLWVSLVIFMTIAAFIVFTIFASKKYTIHHRQANHDEGEATGFAVDSLLNFKSCKYFNNEKFDSIQYDALLAKAENSNLKADIALEYVHIGQGLVVGLGLLAINAYIGHQFLQGNFAISDFVLINSYLLQIASPLKILGVIFREIRQATTDMEDVMSILEITPEMAETNDQPNLLPIKGEIECRNLNFNYTPDQEVLKQVSFSVEPGKKLAIVGESGSGKSTIANLLFGLYQPTQGQIYIERKGIDEWELFQLRKNIAIVPQEPVLYNQSIFYNIAYGQPGCDMETVQKAARLSCIHDFILSLPQSYNTIVGEQGFKLSGGERQRVGIARALVKKTTIFIFDEATSHLDTITEEKIQENLFAYCKDLTVITIAHRLSSVVHADEIIVLEAGCVVERGSHMELLKKEGLYSCLWKKQIKTPDFIPIFEKV